MSDRTASLFIAVGDAEDNVTLTQEEASALFDVVMGGAPEEGVRTGDEMATVFITRFLVPGDKFPPETFPNLSAYLGSATANIVIHARPVWLDSSTPADAARPGPTPPEEMSLWIRVTTNRDEAVELYESSAAAIQLLELAVRAAATLRQRIEEEGED